MYTTIELVGQLDNAVSDVYLDYLQKIFEHLPDVGNTGQFHAYTNGIDAQHKLYKHITQKLHSILDPWHNSQPWAITTAMLLKETKPWYVHTDYSKNDNNPALAFLIPLGWYGPSDSLTHTVIFNEQSLTNDDLDQLESKSPNAQNLHQDLCSHISLAHLGKITVAKICPWKRGRLIYWDRKLLHCSDNFLNQNIVEKRAIVIFTHWI